MKTLIRFSLLPVLLGGVAWSCGAEDSGGIAHNGGGAATGKGGTGGGSASGNGGGLNIDASVGDGAFNPDTSCAAQSEEAKKVPVALYIMQDRSGSMDGQRWADATTALNTFVNDSSVAGMKVALSFFPGGGSCNGAGYDNPVVPMGALPGNASAVQTAIASTYPSGNTPISGALQGVVNYCHSYQQANPKEKVAGLLVTDGQPTDCDLSYSGITNIAANSFGGYGIPIFSMGMDGADFSLMDAIAQAGGTGPTAFNVSQGGATAFLAALQAIAGTLLACEYEMPQPEGGTLDPNKVVVRFTDGSGAQKDLIKMDSEAACGTGDGFFYDNPVTPTKILLCPATCDAAQADDTGKVEILLGCALGVPV
jgi:Mg-chelatase subunit ChlD